MAESIVFLIDTNVFIPVEPTTREHVEALTQPIADLQRIISETGNQMVVHPELYRDVQRDTDSERRRLRLVLANKYQRLRRPPPISAAMENILGRVDQSSHDWIDHSLLATIAKEAADFLITEDDGIHSKARRLGVAERVLKVADALEMVRQLYEDVPAAPPAVEKIDGRALEPTDEIFNSLRHDYEEFDDWLEKVRSENRPAWIISGLGDAYGGLCIVKDEPPGTYNMYGSVLKVCTFKVHDTYEGYRYGELLLKALFSYAEANDYDWLYLTALPQKGFLIDYLSDFGFEYRCHSDNGHELVLAKKRRFSQDDITSLDPYEFHVKFGPPATKWQDTPSYIVPIQPHYHERLFPEADSQLGLFSGQEPHGNAIRKAYVSRSGIKALRRGDILYFYESQGGEGVTTAGIVEEVHVLSDPFDIVRTVGKRTLYSFNDIVRLAKGGQVKILAVNFRQAKVLDRPLCLDELIENHVVTAAPQSIQSIPQGGAHWLAQQTFQ